MTRADFNAPQLAGELPSAQREVEGRVDNLPLPLALLGTSPFGGGLSAHV